MRVSRASGTIEFPADFVLVACANSCPCGRGPPTCTCSDVQRARYARRLSAPLLDRFDLRIRIEAAGPSPGESSAVVAARVAAAVERQRVRLRDTRLATQRAHPGRRAGALHRARRRRARGVDRRVRTRAADRPRRARASGAWRARSPISTTAPTSAPDDVETRDAGCERTCGEPPTAPLGARPRLSDPRRRLLDRWSTQACPATCSAKAIDPTHSTRPASRSSEPARRLRSGSPTRGDRRVLRACRHHRGQRSRDRHRRGRARGRARRGRAHGRRRRDRPRRRVPAPARAPLRAGARAGVGRRRERLRHPAVAVAASRSATASSPRWPMRSSWSKRRISGGARITANDANRYGRDVYALPGSRRNPAAAGCNALLLDGAKPLLDPSDVLFAIGRGGTVEGGWVAPPPPADPDQRAVMKVLGGDPATIDEIERRVAFPTDRLGKALRALELGGQSSASEVSGGRGECTHPRLFHDASWSTASQLPQHEAERLLWNSRSAPTTTRRSRPRRSRADPSSCPARPARPRGSGTARGCGGCANPIATR